MRNQRRPLVLLALVAVVAVGCSNEPAATGDSAPAAGRGQAMEFANCMRTHGVSQFPDPDSAGSLTVDAIANHTSIDTDGVGWRQAIAACQDLEPAGFTGTKRSAAAQATALEFAQCVRENGVKDFPDPDPDGALIDTNRIPSAAGRGARDIPGFDDAVGRCMDVYSGRLGLEK